MTVNSGRPLITPFVWWFAGASGVAGVAAFIFAMNKDDWHWLGFVVPIWIVFFAVCGQAGLLLSLILQVSGHAVLAQTWGTTRNRRRIAAALVFTISTVVTVAVVSVWVAYRQGEPWLEIVVIPICLGLLAALFWSHDANSRSNQTPVVREPNTQLQPEQFPQGLGSD